MKYIIPLLLLFFYSGVRSQSDFMPLSNSIVHYYSQQNDYIVSLKFDSVKTISDTVRYYPFRMLRLIDESTNECTINGPNWIGKQIDVINDSVHVFYNRNNDPVIINSNAGLNDSMIIFDNSPYYNIWAKVVSFYEESFIGLTDSVKTFLLQAKDISGQDISSEWNGTELKLSKHFGYVSMINIYQFPEHETGAIYNYYGDDFKSLIIYGMNNPDHGQGLLDFFDMFNFSVNDEIHDVQVSVSICEYPDIVCRDSTYNVKILLNQQWIDSVTLQYSQSRCYNYKRYKNNVLFTDSSGTDTIVDLFSVSDHKYGMSYQPLYLNGNYTYIINKSSSIIESNMFFGDMSGTFSWLQFDPMYYNYYYNGVGGPYYSYQFTSVHKNILLYFKNDSTEWGIPYNCVVGVQENILSVQNNGFYPNPASDYLFLSGTKLNGTEYSIISVAGIEIKKGNVPNGIINVSELPEGIYFIKITSMGENSYNKFIKGK